MPHAVLGPAPAGRFPRWGYLDRLETNENLPRAGAMALALVSLAVLAVLGLQHFFAGLPEAARPPVEVALGVGRTWPLPPPSIVPRRSGKLGLAVTKLVHTRPVPMPDPVAEQVPISTSQGGQGAQFGEGVSPVDGEGLDDGIPLEPARPSFAEEFIPVEQEPELVTMRAPVYPELARAAGIEGTVLVRVLVGEDGFVKKSALLQGVLGLDEAALEAAGTAVFRPARQQGRPVAVWVVIPIEFRLRP